MKQKYHDNLMLFGLIFGLLLSALWIGVSIFFLQCNAHPLTIPIDRLLIVLSGIFFIQRCYAVYAVIRGRILTK